MSRLLAIFPAELATLERQRRLESLRESYLFAGFDNTLCALVTRSHGERIERWIDDGFTYLELGMRRLPRSGQIGMLLSLASVARKVVAEARRFRADAVLAYDPHLLGLLGLLAARRLEVPLAIRLICNYGLKFEHTGQMSFPPFLNRRIEVAVERALLRQARLVLVACPNHADYARAIAGNIALAPYLTAQAALFYEPITPDPSARDMMAPGARRVLVSIGRLEPEKYSLDLVAFARALDDPEATLVVIGDGSLRAQMEREASTECRTRVVFAGVQTQERVRAMFAVADATVVLQGGGAITEAALSGAAIVAYDYEMNPFVIRPGHDEGLLVPFRDTSALAKAARALLTEPMRARRYRTRARKSALARFSEAKARSTERSIAERMLARECEPRTFDTWQLDLRVEDEGGTSSAKQ